MCRAARRLSIALALIVIGLGFAVRSASAQTAVSGCGQIASGDAYLTNDLDCSQDFLAAVIIEQGRLDLRGFTVKGGQAGVYCVKPIWEENRFPKRNCEVFNGTIEGSVVVGISGKNVDVHDLTVRDVDTIAIAALNRLRFTNLTLVLPPGTLGIWSPTSKLWVDGVGLTVEGGENVVSLARKARLRDVAMSGYSGIAISAGKSIEVTNGSFAGGNRGIDTQRASITNATITGHASSGIRARKLKIADSSLSDNGIDIETEKPPKVENTSCETSNGWGVCSGD